MVVRALLNRYKRLGLDSNFYKKVLPLVLIEWKLFDYAFDSDDRTCQVILGLIGLWWCFAALWVEIRIEQTYPGFQYDAPPDPHMKAYRPFCDFAPQANCSKVLMSPPGRFLRYFGIAKQWPKIGKARENGITWLVWLRGLIDVPNPVLGVLFFGCHLFYPALLLIPIITPCLPWLFFLACVGVGVMTVWLALCLYMLRDFCVVCISMYIANFALIPMMWRICKSHKLHVSDFSFFGEVPRMFLVAFLAMDVLMGIAVVVLYLSEPTHARERQAGSHYLRISP